MFTTDGGVGFDFVRQHIWLISEQCFSKAFDQGLIFAPFAFGGGDGSNWEFFTNRQFCFNLGQLIFPKKLFSTPFDPTGFPKPFSFIGEV